MSRCFYQQPTCSSALSREHIISAAVLREVFGDPVKNVVTAELFGDKSLVDHEPAIRDVCESCNNVGLSPYDAAGIDFIRQVLPSHDPTGLRIKFSREVIGWLIKTHLNYFRVIRDRETNQAYYVNQDIKDALIQHQTVPINRYRLLVEGWIGEDYFWNANDPRHLEWFHYRSVRMRSQRILISDFRIKTLSTWLAVPSDGDYRQFDKRVWSALDELKRDRGFCLQLIDPNTAVRDGGVRLDRVLSLDEVKGFIGPAIRRDQQAGNPPA
jgi:hypothetical protein